MTVSTFSSSLYGILGFFVAPLGGYLADRFGIHFLIMLMTLLTVVDAPLIFIPDVSWQLVNVAFVTIIGVMQTTYIVRWFAAYAPPDHFGNFQGAIFTMCGLISMFVCQVLQAVSEGLLPVSAKFVFPLGLLTLANLTFALLFFLHIRTKDLPTEPPLVEVPAEDDMDEAPAILSARYKAVPPMDCLASDDDPPRLGDCGDDEASRHGECSGGGSGENSSESELQRFASHHDSLVVARVRDLSGDGQDSRLPS